MSRSIHDVGKLGETIACTYLQRKGYSIRERNFQNTHGYKYGEIDIVAFHNGSIVFVEVKTRLAKKNEIIIPEENISPKKLASLEKIAQHYLMQRKLQNKAYRFDALSILLDLTVKTARVKHFENIFF